MRAAGAEGGRVTEQRRSRCTQIITPGGVRQPVRASVRSSIEIESRHLPSRDLEWLRRGLRRQLAELPVGSPASRLVGRQLRLARSELRRRQASDGPLAA